MMGFKLVFVGEQELVPGGSAKHRHFLSQEGGLEDRRGARVHPPVYVLLGAQQRELRAFSHYGPPGRAGWEIRVALVAILGAGDERERGQEDYYRK